MQKGSLYAHIESKADLLWEVAREGAEAFHARPRRGAGGGAGRRADPRGAARPPARRRRAARHRDRLHPRVAVPRGRAPRGLRRRAPPLRGAVPRALPRGPGARRAAHRPRRRRPPRGSPSRPSTGPTPGSGPASTTDELADRFTALLLDGMRGYSSRPWHSPGHLGAALIVNPFASRVKAARARRRAALARVVDLTVIETERPQHATELVSRRARDDAQAVLVFSGDGGFNEALNGLSGDMPIGFLPGGGRASCRVRSGCRSIPSRRPAARATRSSTTARAGSRWARERPALRVLGRRRPRRRRGAPRRRDGARGDGKRPGDIAFALAVRACSPRSAATSSRRSR